MVQIILFIAISILFIGVYPLSGYYQTRNLFKRAKKEISNKSAWYRQSMLWSWIPALVIIVVIVADGYSLKSLGFKTNISSKSAVNEWVVYATLLSVLAYICYNVYYLIILKINVEKRKGYAEQIPAELRYILPVTNEEKNGWRVLAVTAGITEEIQYRGYLFFAIPLLFPMVSVWIVLLISSAVFGLGHIYQGKEAFKPVLAGLYFGFLYIILGSIIPIIVLHILQDLVVVNLLDEQK